MKPKTWPTYVHMYSPQHWCHHNLHAYDLFSTYKQTDITNSDLRNVLSMYMYLVDLLILIMKFNETNKMKLLPIAKLFTYLGVFIYLCISIYFKNIIKNNMRRKIENISN